MLIVSPWIIIVQKAFLVGLFLGDLIFGGLFTVFASWVLKLRNIISQLYSKGGEHCMCAWCYGKGQTKGVFIWYYIFQNKWNNSN